MDFDKYGAIERTGLVQALWRQAYDAVVLHHDLEELREVLSLLRQVVDV